MSPRGAADGDDDSQLFAGVRFALVGFDLVSESQYRSEIVRRGGADAGGRGADCTHVVVCGLVYDDPVCVAAREDGKQVVTELWVDDSLDLGVLADADRVLYRPVRDLNGILGSESLHICLTGYQKNGREDIMKMVTLMGAQFSKPLIAHKVTHLICYKFEGEKYELAKRVKTNLVNHQWLEDCLKAWEILPIDNYTKSGWELEIMEAQAKDSEDEAEDAGRGSSDSRGIARSTPITEIRMRTHVDPNVHAPICGPTISTGNAEVAAGRHLGTPQQIRKTEDLSKRSLDIRADIQSCPNTNDLTISANPDAHNSIHPPINPIGNEEAPADQVSRDEANDGNNTALDTRAGALCTPNTNGVTVRADRHVHQSIVIPAIPVENINIDGKCLDNVNQINVDVVLCSTPSEENFSEKTLHSSNISRKVDQKDDGPGADLDATVGQSKVKENLTLCEANLRPAGNAAILSDSRRRSRKPVSPEANLKSIHQTASPQSFEGNTPRVEFIISPSRSDRKISELPDAQGLRDDVVKHANRSGHALAQRKSRLSSTSPKPPNEGTDSATGVTNSSFSSRACASKTVTFSDLGRNSTESTKVDGHQDSDPTLNLTEMQKSGSFKNNSMSYRRTSLKLVRSSEVETLPENYANDENMESLGKAKALARHEAAAEKGCAISPSVNSEVGKASSIFSLQNGETEMSDSPQADKIEVVAPNSEPDKVVSLTTLEACHKEIPVTTLTGEYGTFPQKVPTSRMRNAGARSRKAGNERDLVFVDSKKVAASKSKLDKVVSHENVEAELEKNCTSPRAAEYTTFFPEEILCSRARNAVAKSSLDANSEMNDVLAVSKTEFANVISQENMEKNPKKLSSIASADESQRSSSEKMPNSIARNAVAKVSRTTDTKMADAPIIDKSETIPLKSNFIEAVPPENAEAYPKKLSSSASADDRETCTPNRVPNNRVRKAVAKRKVSAVQQHRSGSEPCKTGSVFLREAKVVTSKRAVESSTNAGKVTVDQDPQKANEDGTTNAGGSFCKEAMEDGDLQNTNSGSNKRQKTADLMDGSTNHNKENIPVNTNLPPKSKYGNDRVSSKCITKAVQNGKNEAKVVTSKRAVESSTNAGKVTVDQYPQKANEDGTTNAGGSFCKEAMEDGSKDLQNTNSGSNKRQKTADLMDGSTNHNKENIPVNTNLPPKSKYGNDRVSSKCITKAVQNDKNELADRSMIDGNDCGTLTVLEPTWFILSGHRLLRKEYKSILKHLKGRVCRDSHHWSFQATHFITPELRRTEKFFAAAAAGRWILKSDYLTACNEAGKFVEEEPFEWHGHGLNNGDTISLDAPRKWRQLRQRTGHGAFYGMQIIIYGECISPSLDTLKRAVRAGDGTILATSPPYTRFLKPGVCFAVVSAGMPSADAWVQEFQSHNIPCISADYLVEYVCKPGHPLDKHVLFNMHDLADKSLQKLLETQQDLLSAGTGEASEGGDAEAELSCSVCESNDREGPLLICGTKGNRAGCGVGMHIDCWNPHLEVAPDGEWLCPKCDEHMKSPKKAKKSAKSGVPKRR